jgi:glutamine phosphoribosylpyrophosphate amidotransferase
MFNLWLDVRRDGLYVCLRLQLGKKDWAMASESVALECLDFEIHRKWVL